MTGDASFNNNKNIKFYELGTNGNAYVGIKGAENKGDSASYTISLPAAGPAAGNVLKANSSTPTTLEWASDTTDTAAANLTGNTLATGVVNSSLTSVGTLASLTVTATITGSVSGSSGSCTGNAATAAKLASSVTIGGATFDGSANIDLPGVNTAGDQNTSGTAAVATAITVADESTETSCNVLFTTAATGDLGAKSGTNLTFNSNTGELAATLFSGSGTSLTALNASNISSGTLAKERVATLNQSTTGTAAGLTNTPNITVGTIGCGNITGTGTVSDSKGNLRSIPLNPATSTTSSSYTLVASDAGKCIVAGSTVVIPNATIGGGDAVTIVNNSASEITLTNQVANLYNTADGTTPTKLAARGMATILFMYGGTTAYISGAGLS